MKTKELFKEAELMGETNKQKNINKREFIYVIN